MQGLYDRMILAFFVACGVSRLARYNVTAEEMSGRHRQGEVLRGHAHSHLVRAGLRAHAWRRARRDRRAAVVRRVQIAGFTLHPLALMFALSGSLMISRIRIPKL